MSKSKQHLEGDSWNPGIASTIPNGLLPQVTLFRAENSYVEYSEARELSSFVGLSPEAFVCFRPERLIIHELLIRVTADLSVPDGPDYGELGVNLRSMVATIYEQYVVPEIDQIACEYVTLKEQAGAYIDAQLDATIFPRVKTNQTKVTKPGFLVRILGGAKQKVFVPDRLDGHQAISVWQAALGHVDDPMEQMCLKGLIKFVGGILGHRGRLVADRELIQKLALNYVCTTYGSKVIGRSIEPVFERAVTQENYLILPPQQQPVVMNVKGASASGKSTVRPQQRKLAGKLNVPWESFALISPDYWRKYLLDYDGLGDDYKYAAMLTGQELEIIDKKLDHYMAEKASVGKMSHLLIDRFRFDSFTLEKNRSADNRLLTRFGDRIFMFFMVTSPSETVKRAWERGRKTGRFKAVDDLLNHNIEAYEGMPELFFSWALSTNKQVHFEFLDNDVPEGRRPKTIAFGWNNAMTILDVESLVNIERYKKVNVAAKTPETIFKTIELSVESNLGFLSRCIAQISEVNFVDQSDGTLFARAEEGKLVWCDAGYLAQQNPKSSVHVLFNFLGCQSMEGRGEAIPVSLDVKHEQQFTFGRWGTRRD